MTQEIRIRRWLAFLLAALLVFSTLSTALAAGKTFQSYQTTSMSNVNLRKRANGTSTILKRIKVGDTVTIVGKSGNYYQIQFDGKEGYALIKYIDGTDSGADPEPDESLMHAVPLAVTSYPYDTTTLGYVKLRKKANRTADVYRTIPVNSLVTVLSVEGDFARVEYDGQKGYVYAKYVNLANIPTPTPVPTATPKPGSESYALIKSGDTGAMVTALQQALIELKYLSEGDADGKYGTKTEQAVKLLQKRNGLTQTGQADAELQLLIYEGTPKDVNSFRQHVKTIPPIAGAVIKLNGQGEVVTKAQTRLKELGYYTSTPSGVCDALMVSAIEEFERKNSLVVDGALSATDQNLLYSTWALDASVAVTPTPTPVPEMPKDVVRPGDKSNDVKLVQTRLTELGYLTSKVTGTFDDDSVKALKKFQKANGLDADGVCGIQTRAVLFAAHPVYAVPTATPVIAANETPEPTYAPITKENCVTIKAGSQGMDVKRLQIRLQELGYYTSRQDGIYLTDDIAAVRAFQKANGLTTDGKAGYNTQTVLYSNAAKRADNANSDVIASSKAATLRYGSQGVEVQTLQNKLISLGYLSGSADGKFGSSTRRAVKAFQQANGLSPDGIVGAATQAKLGDGTTDSGAVSNTVPYVTLYKGATGEAVKAMQNRLIALGYLTGKADGKFGNQTSLALIAFQRANGLKADGIMGSATTKKLNQTSGTVNNGGTTTIVTPTTAPNVTTISAASVRYANWYTEIRAKARKYPNVTVYDFSTGLSWQLTIFSNGAHADAIPITAEDTAKMNKAFGKTTWNPKPVWVMFSDGSVYMASTHNTPHGTYNKKNINNFAGHLCVHFPRTKAEVEAIGPYATSHQKAIDQGWEVTQKRAGR